MVDIPTLPNFHGRRKQFANLLNPGNVPAGKRFLLIAIDYEDGDYCLSSTAGTLQELGATSALPRNAADLVNARDFTPLRIATWTAYTKNPRRLQVTIGGTTWDG